jgi:hypothetical protein
MFNQTVPVHITKVCCSGQEHAHCYETLHILQSVLRVQTQHGSNHGVPNYGIQYSYILRQKHPYALLAYANSSSTLVGPTTHVHDKAATQPASRGWSHKRCHGTAAHMNIQESSTHCHTDLQV